MVSITCKQIDCNEEVRSIIDKFKGEEDEALDGDLVDELCKHLRTEIDLMEGNITNEEYSNYYRLWRAPYKRIKKQPRRKRT